MATTDAPWYDRGLHFECTRCGNCCGGGPGTVRVTDAEIERLAQRLALAVDAFRERFTRPLRGGDVSLVEQSNFDCVFYRREIGCAVHSDRPQQCRTWPFWRSNLHSPENWFEAAQDCPGMNNGPLHPRDDIDPMRRADGTSKQRPAKLAGNRGGAE